MPTDELMQYERDGSIVTIRFNRPDKLNAFSDDMVRALGDALHRFDTDPDANVAVLCGNGRAFSSGADVQQRQLRPREELERLGGPEGSGARIGDVLTRAVNWKPVIAAPHGYVLGLAVGIVLESDLIVAEAGTRFQITETSRGIGGAKYWGLMQFRGGGAFGNEVAAHRSMVHRRGGPRRGGDRPGGAGGYHAGGRLRPGPPTRCQSAAQCAGHGPHPPLVPAQDG